MTENKWRKRVAVAVICVAAIAAEAAVWEKFVTTTLYGQARPCREPTEVSAETAPTEPVLETEAPDPREAVWANYSHLGVIREGYAYADIYASPDSYAASIGKALPGYGFEMDVSESNATWTKVNLDGHTGYIRSEYVATGMRQRNWPLRIASMR